MTTTQSRAAAAVRIGAGLGRRKRGELLGLLRPWFARVEPWLRAGKYAAALMGQIPGATGGRSPSTRGTGRRIRSSGCSTGRSGTPRRRWAWCAGSPWRAWIRRPPGGAWRWGRSMRPGRSSRASTPGVKRHYFGCAGKVANGITTVHLAYAREHAGHAMIAARQWIPREHIEDRARSLAMGLPPGLAFRTKGQLAIDLLAETFADSLRLDHVCGDEVHGSCASTAKPAARATWCASRRTSASRCPATAYSPSSGPPRGSRHRTSMAPSRRPSQTR